MTTVPDRVARPSGWYGMLILLASESALFGTLIGTYVYLRFRTPAWPPPGVADPSVAAPLVLALVLAATSLPMTYAVRAGHAGRRQAALSAVALAFAVQAAYLVVQAHLYLDGIATLHPSANAYASIYFTLLAVHHLHVGAGLLLDVWILARLSTGLTRYRETALSAIALYWYVVGAIGLLVTATTLSPAW